MKWEFKTESGSEIPVLDPLWPLLSFNRLNLLQLSFKWAVAHFVHKTIIFVRGVGGFMDEVLEEVLEKGVKGPRIRLHSALK